MIIEFWNKYRFYITNFIICTYFTLSLYWFANILILDWEWWAICVPITIGFSLVGEFAGEK